MTDKEKKGKKVFHLELPKETDPKLRNQYFTNLKSLVQNNPTIGYSYWHFVRFKEEDFPIVKDNYVIRIDYLRK